MQGAYPLLYDWTGEAMVPRGRRYAEQADKLFTVGEVYRLDVVEERSAATHRHYFAAIYDGWVNLPEDMIEDYPTPEHLRKKALIRTGYRDERSIVCASHAEALRIAAFIKPIDEYAVVLVREAVIRIYTAQSQSMRAMGKKDFQDSKQSVLDFVADLIGTKTADLVKQGEAA